MSLAKAARETHTSPRSVLRYAGSAFQRTETGRLVAKPSDRLFRLLRLPTPSGEVDFPTADLRTASKGGRYLNAVKAYYTRGDRRALREFRGKSIRAFKVSYRFETDTRVLDRLEAAHAITLEDLYVRA